ncbi:MAG: sortase [Actinobacteria bacterium]|nr:sortase [Actinomycetota bacterium]
MTRRSRHVQRAGRAARPSRRRAASVLATLSILSALGLASCGSDTAMGSAGAIERAGFVTPTTAGDATPDTTAPDTTAVDDPTLVAPSTTELAVDPSTTEPATTPPSLAPTTVVTLPTPVPPPPPRADEPFVELGRLEIPRIGVDTTLLQGITLTTLDQGPGHWPGTALPGQIGNVVVAGHRTSHNKVFRHVDRLLPGDEVVFTTGDGRFVYTVRETTIVTPDAMYIIDQTYAPTATLFACHPPGSTRERIVVHLDLASSEPAPASA